MAVSLVLVNSGASLLELSTRFEDAMLPDGCVEYWDDATISLDD
jgi:hypothetical protein